MRTVTGQDFDGEVSHVLDSGTGGLPRGPELKVLKSVVSLDRVSVMDIFTGKEVAAERFLHDDNVLTDVVAPLRSRAGMTWRLDEDVTAVDLKRAAALVIVSRHPATRLPVAGQASLSPLIYLDAAI